jgi:hypothetical protein
MSSHPRTIEIDITRQARALAWLRLTDYALVVMCGLMMISLLSDLVVGSHEVTSVIFDLIGSLLLGFAAYTGWRHVGVIDPSVWKAYRFVFPAMVVFCLFMAWGVLLASGSLSGLLDDKNRVEAIQRLSGLFSVIWIAAVSLLGWVSLMLLRRMKIPGTDATVDKVMSRLADKAGVKAVQVANFRPINRPRGLAMGGVGIVILLAIVLAPTPKNKILAELILRESQSISLLGFFLLLRARRYFQIDADSLLAVDHRPPILFLRSFDDDEKQTYSRSDRALLDFSLETRLCNHFSRFGPFVAIGSPKETVPQLGAARVLLSDDDWQPRVLGWMRQANLIIMYSGKTHWVNWELRQVLENDCAARLILMMPEIKSWRRSKRNADISARAEQIREVFKASPWEQALSEFQDFAGLRAILFRPDGSTVMVKSRSRKRDSYHLAALVTHEILLDAELSSEVVPAAIPVAASNRMWRYIAGTAAATALLCALVGYAFLRHASARPDPVPVAASDPSAADKPPLSSAPESRENPVEKEVASPVSADTAAAPLAKVAVQAQPEKAEPQVLTVPTAQPQEKLLRPAVAQQAVVPQTVEQPAPPADPTIMMLANANEAVSSGRLAAPLNDCALYWARQLTQAGNPQGANVEKYVLDTMGKEIDSARASGNYNAAIQEVDSLAPFYPGSSQLAALRSKIETEQQSAVVQSQFKKFVVEHRHVLVANNGNLAQAYCVGVLTVAPNGMAGFECTVSFDPQGRCDHILFPVGAIKEVKFLKNGLLHVATTHMGNFDFYGDAPNLQGAYEGLGALVR